MADRAYLRCGILAHGVARARSAYSQTSVRPMNLTRVLAVGSDRILTLELDPYDVQAIAAWRIER